MNKYIWGKQQVKLILCIECSYFQNKLKCKAFPSGIPEDILTGDFNHTKKHPKQDNDILFESIDKDK